MIYPYSTIKCTSTVLLFKEFVILRSFQRSFQINPKVIVTLTIIFNIN